MCFYVSPEFREVQVAKKAMAVYKISYSYFNDNHGKEFVPRFQYPFVYLKEKLVKRNVLRGKKYPTGHGINIGLHSYATSKIARERRSALRMSSVERIGQFIIPKGARYLKNENGEIVSNKLYFKKFMD